MHSRDAVVGQLPVGLRFVVTGCARSGTAYMSALLKELGVACGHEAVFNVSGPGRPIPREAVTGRTGPALQPPEDAEGDSSWLAAPFVGGLPDGAVVLHQVRDPLAVVRSLMGIRFLSVRADPLLRLRFYGRQRGWIQRRVPHPLFVQFVRANCPSILAEPTALDRSAAYWVRWNQLVERADGLPHIRYLRYRLEDLDDDLLFRLMELLDVRVDRSTTTRVLAEVSRTTNTRQRDETVRWETLPDTSATAELRALAARYGYGA